MIRNEDAPDARAKVVACDLCIVGAGLAGLNALFAATRHLPRDAKIVVVDRNAAAGGMWNGTYDYVRLHQPHRMFTAGNIPWSLQAPPSHLATRGEVLEHLKRCFETLAERANVERFHGYDYVSHDESTTGVRIACAPVVSGSPPLRIEAKRCIKAMGYDVTPNPPIAVSSANVRSVSPDAFDVLGEEMRSSDAPIYVVGGGKTGMDTAHALITTFPGKKVHLLIGSGTIFSDRNKAFPTGMRRWFGGTTPLAAFQDLARRFDGTNEAEVLEYFRPTYAVGLNPDCRRYMFGLLSPEENEVISKGATEILPDYLRDVVDRDGTPTMILRSGAVRPLEQGTFIVNCTGYVGRVSAPYEPYISEHGNVLSVQTTSMVNFLTSQSAFILTHLFFLEQLGRVPFYEIDLRELRAKTVDAFPFAAIAHTLYNFGLVLDSMPQSALDEFGLDLARWFPVHRQVIAGLGFVRFDKKHREHLRRSLDIVRDRFGVRCGPLRHVGSERPSASAE